MPNNDFEFNLDDILAEFRSDVTETAPSESVRRQESQRPAVPVIEPEIEEANEPVFELEEEVQQLPEIKPVKKAEPLYKIDDEGKQKRLSPEEKLEMYKRAQENRRTSSEKKAANKLNFDEFEAQFAVKSKKEKKHKEEATPKAKKEKVRFEEESALREKPAARKANGKAVLISLCAYALLLVWGIFNVHPGASLPKPTPIPVVPTPVVTEAPVETPTDSQTGEDTQQEELPPVPTEPPKPHYTIADGSVLAPKANPANFGQVPVASASELDAVIQQARDSGLLREDEKMVFDPSLEFNTGSYYQDIMYYYDETMLAIAWKQIVDGNTVTCMEVKVADASQFRRKITGDTYGSPSDYLTNLNKSTNAVVSMNADFYQFRDYGVMVYDGTLYKCTDKRYLVHNGIDYKWYNCLDNCFITKDGDMLFTYFGEEFSWDEMQQFVTDNDITFSLSFGPILVDNYEVQDHYVGWYPVGEVDQGYSRAGFGQVDERHYLYMSLNHSDEKSARWTMYEFGQFFQSRGVEKAYAFDGGQTSEIIFNGQIYNHIDKSSERWVSDMVYFGTAIPEEVWNNG